MAEENMRTLSFSAIIYDLITNKHKSGAGIPAPLFAISAMAYFSTSSSIFSFGTAPTF